MQPEEWGHRKKLTCHIRVATELLGEGPTRIFTRRQQATLDCGAGGVYRKLPKLGLAVKSKTPHALAKGISDIGCLLDRVSEGQSVVRHTCRKAKIEFGSTGDIETRAHRAQQSQDFGRWIGLDRVVN